MKALPSFVEDRIMSLCHARNVTLLRVRNPRDMGDYAALHGIIRTITKTYEKSCDAKQLANFLQCDIRKVKDVIRIMDAEEKEHRIRTFNYAPREDYGKRIGAKARS